MLDKFKLLSQFMQFATIAILSVGLYGLLEAGRSFSSGEVGVDTAIHLALLPITFFIARAFINSGSPKESDAATPDAGADDFYNDK